MTVAASDGSLSIVSEIRHHLVRNRKRIKSISVDCYILSPVHVQRLILFVLEKETSCSGRSRSSASRRLAERYFLIRVPVLDPVRAEPQPLEFSSCDFGRAWVQPHFVHRITIANHTGEPLTIIAITGSCKCTTVRALADTIPAHDTVPVELVLDLRDAEKDAAFKSSLMARLKKLDGEEVLAETTITGAVDKCPLQIDKPAGEILLSIQGVDDLLTGQVRLRADADYQFTAVPDGRVVGAVTIDTSHSGSETVFDYAITPDLSKGEHAGTIRICAATKEREGLLFVPLRVRVVPDVVATPSTVVWGHRPIGETASEFLTIRTRSGKVISDLKVEHAPGFLTASEGQSPIPDARLVEVRSVVGSSGNHAGVLRFKLQLEGEESPQTLDVPVNVFGIAP